MARRGPPDTWVDPLEVVEEWHDTANPASVAAGDRRRCLRDCGTGQGNPRSDTASASDRTVDWAGVRTPCMPYQRRDRFGLAVQAGMAEAEARVCPAQ